MSKSKSPIDSVMGKFRSGVATICVLMFGLGVAHAMPVQLIYALGILSALFLVRLYRERRGR
ncbi:hypothetical protein [Amycolatopsis sp. cmx-4-68]|uniref:hypothetical protein n=1 Tax=Amycolatopsis sp. cmx-4-68 TaxID=2790938 RepID=UPI00397E28BA